MAHYSRPALDAVSVELRHAAPAPILRQEVVQERGLRAAGEGASRRSRPRLSDLLGGSPLHLTFIAAMRRLESVFRSAPRFGEAGDPALEPVRFAQDPSLAFRGSALTGIVHDDETTPARVEVSYFGAFGPHGPFPTHLTQYIDDQRRQRGDRTWIGFLDIFHHRMISLFYRAWEKHRFTAAYERGESDRLTEHLLDLVGVGLETLRGRLSVPDEALAFYAGLLSLPPRGAVALEQLIEDFFDVPATVEQFVGGWYPLPLRDQCALGDGAGASAQLGLGAVAGDEIWDQQARVRIRLGPMPRARYEEFLPTGAAHERLRALVRFFGHDQFDFEVQLALSADEVPGLVLGADDGEPQRLGWSTWIRTRPLGRDADETVLVL